MRLSFLSLSPPSSCSFHCFFIYLQGYLPNKLKSLMLLELLVTFTNIYGQMTHRLLAIKRCCLWWKLCYAPSASPWHWFSPWGTTNIHVNPRDELFLVKCYKLVHSSLYCVAAIFFFFFKVQNFPRVVPPLLLTRKCKFPGGALNQCKVGIYKISAAAPFHVKKFLISSQYIDQNAMVNLCFFPLPFKKMRSIMFWHYFFLVGNIFQIFWNPSQLKAKKYII